MLAGLAAGAGETWEETMQVASLLAAAGALAVVASAVLRRRGAGRRGLTAAEPVLAAFPLGLAAAAGGLDADGGDGLGVSGAC